MRIQGDISSAYMTVRSICERIENHRENDLSESIQILEKILVDRSHSDQSRAYFLYREAALGLASIMRVAPSLHDHCHSILKNQALTAVKAPCLAASEAMGSLPVQLPGPEITPPKSVPRPLSLDELVRLAGIRKGKAGWKGRTLLIRDQTDECLLAVKCSRRGDPLESLELEAAWMDFIRTRIGPLPNPLSIPRPLHTEGGSCLRVLDLPCSGPCDLHSQGFAMAYVAPEAYFVYANESRRLSFDLFLKTMENCGLLLGRLAAQGILHTALIPLFHNRIQQARRDDLGRYRWMRMGRLDKWLDSCRHPNLGLSGIRDFEHFASYRHGGRDLFRIVGEQFLSLFLTAGSYFRERDPKRCGTDGSGLPADARDLFDPALLKQVLQGIVRSFYQGMTGCRLQDDGFISCELVGRMIDEMGVDRHMEETIRVQDQLSMDRKALSTLLFGGGYSREQAESVEPGFREITLLTGPHLGEFNGPISLPELPLLAAGSAACCIAGLYLEQLKY